jgi:uncharacterized protein (DUF362 family)
MFEMVREKETAMTKISLVSTLERAAGTTRALQLLQSNPVKGKEVVLKPNFNTADPAPGSSDINTIRALVLALKEMGAAKITLAERSGPGPTTRQQMEKKGIFALATELGFDILNLEEMGSQGWVLVTPTDSHWKNGFLFARIYREAASIVETCCLKTHQYGGHFTLSLKLAVGMVPGGLMKEGGQPYMNELHSSPFQRQMIAEINTAFKPDLIVMDGVEAFVKGGPHEGTRKAAGVMLAGQDRIAMDAVGVAILRLLGTTPEVSKGKIFEQDQIQRAVELGLGVSSSDQIQIITDDQASENMAAQIRPILAKG